ncbi:MAG TPA: hypothetical protein VM846_04865 [Vicinamibacterales bacterium]|nr:hypothetical protein [Vicinamibacterales bacterium]
MTAAMAGDGFREIAVLRATVDAAAEMLGDRKGVDQVLLGHVVSN